MAVYSRSEKITRKTIFSVPSPSPYVEVAKAISAARSELVGDRHEDYDDAVMVESWDDEIHVSYTREISTPKPEQTWLAETAELDSVIFHMFFASGKWEKRTKDLSNRDREAAAQSVERHIDTMRQNAYDHGARVPEPGVLDNPDVMGQKVRWWEPEV